MTKLTLTLSADFNPQSPIISGIVDVWTINDVGQIVGSLYITGVPEASTMLLFGPGLIGLVGFRRRIR